MLTAETAVLIELQTLGGVFLVLDGVVVPLLALIASEDDFDSHCGTSCSIASLLRLTKYRLFVFLHTKISLSDDR